MRTTNVALDSDAFADAKQVLMDEYGLSEEEAERKYEQILTNVMLEAQDAGRDWERDEYEAVVDVLMGIQRQQMERLEAMEQSRLTTVARFLPHILHLGAFILALSMVWVSAHGGPSIALYTAGLFVVVILAATSVFLS